MRSLLTATTVFIILCLAGCATPQPVLDQARNTAALTTSLAAEQREFLRVQRTVAQTRIQNIKDQLSRLARYQSTAKFDSRVSKIAGQSDTEDLAKKLQELSDSRIQDETELKATLKSIDETLAKVATTIPDSSSKTNSLQKALLPLGDELSASERLQNAVQFAQKVKEGVDAAKEKIKDSEAITPSPLAPLPPQ